MMTYVALLIKHDDACCIIDGTYVYYFQGFGFATFARQSEAETARLQLNGVIIEGRKIEVFHFSFFRLLFYFITKLKKNIFVVKIL